MVKNTATLLDDTDEIESVALLVGIMKHGATVDMTPRYLGGDGVLYVDEEYLLFRWDNEKLYYNTEKPVEEDLKELDSFELN